MHAPIVSIIMPVHNTESFIEKSLSSLQSQTLKNIEIICINDASTDKSENIIRAVMQDDERIKLIQTPVQSGSSTARNYGLREATGQYIMFCDSDDWYEPQMCELMVDTIETKDVDFAMCDAHIINHDPMRGAGADYHRLNTFGFHKLDQNNRFNIRSLIWNKIFKKALVDQYNIHFPEGTNGGDYSFVIQYLAVSSCAFGLNQCLYNYVLREGSVVSNALREKSKTTINRIKNYRHIYDFLVQHDLMQKNASFFAQAMWHEINWLVTTHKDKGFLEEVIDIGQEVMQDFDMSYISDSLPEKKLLDAVKNKQYTFLCTYFEIDPRLRFLNAKRTKIKFLGINIISTKTSKKYTQIKILGIPFFQIEHLQ